MPFDDATSESVKTYVDNHMADPDWFLDYFSFVVDADLRRRLADEFMAARYIYKLLEGLQVEDWLQVGQVRTQVLQYASIYEAALHHVLFEQLSHLDPVKSLLEQIRLKRFSIPSDQREALADVLSHDGKQIVTCFEGSTKVDVTKIRFDAKVLAGNELGLLQADLAQELIELYEARNGIHIHAELKKGIQYELEVSMKAFKNRKRFKAQIEAGIEKLVRTP